MKKGYLRWLVSLIFTVCILSGSLANSLLYSTFLGGSEASRVFGIAVDSAGNAYITGLTYSPDFPVTSNAFQTTDRDTTYGNTAFISKINTNSSGTASLVYSTFLGGSGKYAGDASVGIAIDSVGNAYITGVTGSLDFPITTNAFQTTNGAIPNGTAFISKINTDSSGTASLIYSSYLGGSGGDGGDGIAVDSAGNAYITGDTYSADFPLTSNAFQTTIRSTSFVAFISKINTNFSGTASLVYSSYLGGSGNGGYGDGGNGIAVDSAGNAYITGFASSTDFPITSNAFQTTNRDTTYFSNCFISKINTNSSGTASLVYSSYLGGSGAYFDDSGYGIAVDSIGNAYLTGFAGSTDFPVTSNAFQTINRDTSGSAFISKINTNSSGTASLVYSSFLGGSGNGVYGDAGKGIAIDSAGNAYITGYAGSTDFPITSNAFQTTDRVIDNFTAFISKINTNSSGTVSLVYSSYLGGSINDGGRGVAVDSAGNVYITGNTESTDFPVTLNAFQTVDSNTAGGFTAFVTKLSTIPLVAITDWESYSSPSVNMWNGKEMDTRKPRE